MIKLLFAIIIAVGFFCALMAEIGVGNARAFKIAAWALWFVAALMWALPNG